MFFSVAVVGCLPCPWVGKKHAVHKHFLGGRQPTWPQNASSYVLMHTCKYILYSHIFSLYFLIMYLIWPRYHIDLNSSWSKKIYIYIYIYIYSQLKTSILYNSSWDSCNSMVFFFLPSHPGRSPQPWAEDYPAPPFPSRHLRSMGPWEPTRLDGSEIPMQFSWKWKKWRKTVPPPYWWKYVKILTLD